MKKVTLILIFITLAFFSCAKDLTSPIGKWSGKVLIVNVEYEFNRNNTFQVSTLSVNNVQVGGGKGTYAIEDGIITLNYDSSYFFDSDTEVGEWKASNKVVEFRYSFSGKTMKLEEVTKGTVIKLKKK